MNERRLVNNLIATETQDSCIFSKHKLSSFIFKLYMSGKIRCLTNWR